MIFSGEKVSLHVTIPIEIYNEMKKESAKLAPIITNLLIERYLATATNRPVMETKPDESEAKPMSLKELVRATIGECGIDFNNAKTMGGFKPFEVDKVYESLRKRTATSKDAVYKVMMDLIK